MPRFVGSVVPSGHRLDAVHAALHDIERRRRPDVLSLPEGSLDVHELDRVIWPTVGLTKGDLMRFYIRLAPPLLSFTQDRPLSWRPFPNGLDRPSRFHQRVKWKTPPAVRVEQFDGMGKAFDRRFIGGSLLTLLYMVEHHIISIDGWLSRLTSPDHPDFAVIDLDPMPPATFPMVRDVACHIRRLLQAINVPSYVKTSGLTGLHIFIPLAAGTDFRTARTFAEVVAERIVQRHSRLATTDRLIAHRGGRVYVDCTQNMRAKTLAVPYSARHSPFAGVSTPVTWNEVEHELKAEDFTIVTTAQRLAERGDPWESFPDDPGIDVLGLVGMPLRRG